MATYWVKIKDSEYYKKQMLLSVSTQNYVVQLQNSNQWCFWSECQVQKYFRIYV